MRDITSAFDMVPDSVKNVARQISEYLKSKGVPHAIIGGVAVSAYSPPRTTKDVDFLIPESNSDVAYELDPEAKPISGMYLQGLGIKLDDQEVDLMFLPDDIPEEFLNLGPTIDGIHILSIEMLILLKLKSGRAKDTSDIVEMLKAGGDKQSIKHMLESYAPDVTEDFESLSMMADFESGKLGDIKGQGKKAREASIGHLMKKIK